MPSLPPVTPGSAPPQSPVPHSPLSPAAVAIAHPGPTGTKTPQEPPLPRPLMTPGHEGDRASGHRWRTCRGHMKGTPVGTHGVPSGDEPLDGQLEVAAQGGWQCQPGDSGVTAGTQVTPDGHTCQVLQPPWLSRHAHGRGIELLVLLQGGTRGSVGWAWDTGTAQDTPGHSRTPPLPPTARGARPPPSRRRGARGRRR